MKKDRISRVPTLTEAIIGLLLVIITILALFKLKVGTPVPLVGGAAVSVIIAFYLGFDWESIQKSMLEGISHTLISVLILILVGMTVGTWIIGGTVQTLIYYGVNLISPSIFLVVTFILCAVTSLATGTSWGTIATVGLATMGVGLGLEIPPAITAGAIASGAFFGDKMSPLSDTTNVASAVTETNIFDHIGSMLWTTGPAAIISMIIFQILNMKYANGTGNFETINTIVTTLQDNYNLTVLTLVPALIVLVLSAMRVPALITLFLSVFAGGLNAMITQGAPLKAVLNAAYKGFTSETGVAMVDKILSRGGISMMTTTIVIILIATAMGGILEKAQILKVIIDSLSKFIKSAKGLIVTTLVSTYLVLFVANNQLVSIIVSGRTFVPAYKKYGIDSRVLSRTLEDSATLGSVILPWGTSALFLMSVLGVDASYIPYAFLSFLSPLVAIVLAFTGIGVFKTKVEEKVE